MSDRVGVNQCGCGCGSELPAGATRRRRFLNASHRKAAQRLRAGRIGAGQETSPDAEQAAAVEAYLVGRTAPPDEQVVSAVHEAVLLAGVFMRLSIEARPQFAWRCAEMAAALNAALSRLFGVKS